MHRAVALDQPVEINVVQVPHHDVHRVAVQGVDKGGKLPTAKVSGKKQHSLAPGDRPFVVLEAIVDHHPAHVFLGVAGKLADLS